MPYQRALHVGQATVPVRSVWLRRAAGRALVTLALAASLAVVAWIAAPPRPWIAEAFDRSSDSSPFSAPEELSALAAPTPALQ